MSTMDYFRSATQGLHKDLTEAIKDLSNEQLHFRPLDKGSHIAFLIWHDIRTEDLVINSLQQKKTPVWNAEGWDKKLGMDPKSQGTGMTAEQAAAVRINDLQGFLQYMASVFKATDAFLAGLKDEDLSEVRDYPMLGKRSLFQLIGGVVLSHGSSHLGEIWYIKGLLGLKGSPV